MAKLYLTPTQNALQYTLDSGYTAGGTTLTLSSTISSIVQAPGVCVVDRIDSSGNKTPTKRDYFTFTGVSGAQLTGVSGGQAGSTNQNHSVGAIVEFLPDVVWAQGIYDVITTEHTVNGVHASLASITYAKIMGLVVPSLASITFGDVGMINVPSTASINNAYVKTYLNASGASLNAINDIVPVWTFAGTVSGASANLGFPVDMPYSGTVRFVSAILRAGSSAASLFLDITKNGTSFLNATASQSVLTIPVNGTFASTGSIANPIFAAGDVFNFSVKGAGSFGQDLTVKFSAR